MNVNSWRDFANTEPTVYTEDDVMPEVNGRHWIGSGTANVVGSALARLLVAAGFRSRPNRVPTEMRS